MVTEIGKGLRLIRINTGDSLRTMADKLGISASYLSSIENGKRNIPENFLNSLFDAYDLDDQEKALIKTARENSLDTYKVNLANISENKRKVLLSLAEDSLDEAVVDKLCQVIDAEKDKTEKL